MKELLRKLRSLERALSEERGPFTLFGLFLREGAPDRWDLVAAAPWLQADRYGALEEFSRRLTALLEPEEIVRISHIGLLPSESSSLNTLLDQVEVEHGDVPLAHFEFRGIPIERARIITCKRREPAAV